MIRSEIRWYTFHLPDKQRPVLVLTQDEVIDRLNEIIVVPVTRTVRGLRTEILLTEDDDMPTVCAANFDHLALGQRNRFGSLLTTLSERRRPQGTHSVVDFVRLRSGVRMPGKRRC